MKEVKRYKCEYCGTVFESQEDCEDCESQHVLADGVEYNYEHGDVYPRRITVRFNNCRVAEYIIDFSRNTRDVIWNGSNYY